MSKPIPQQALVVVADGGKALLLRNTGAGLTVALTEERRVTLKDFVDDGPSGDRPPEQSPGETREATFAKQVVKLLTAMHDKNEFKDLVLIADPGTLGEMRAAMHKTLEHSVAFSLAKDYTNMSIGEITAILS